MFEQILTFLGKPFVVPAVLMLSCAWIFNKLSALHDSRRRGRTDFLEHWHDVDNMSDMRLEVITRHFVGSYIPADVIRTINRMPFPTQTLFDLEGIWAMLRFDHTSKTLDWNDSKMGDAKYRFWRKIWAFLGYVALVVGAVFFFGLVLKTEPSRWMAWLSAFNTLALFILAMSCLARFDTLGQADRNGAALLSRINAALPRKSILVAGERSDET